MDTKRIGNIGEAMVIAQLVENEMPVYPAFGDNESADLVAEIRGQLVKIQVKTCTSLKQDGGSYVVDLRRNKNPWTSTTGSVAYTPKEVDYFATYCTITKQICWFKVSELQQMSVTLRIQPPQNGATKNIRYESDYSFSKVFGI